MLKRMTEELGSQRHIAIQGINAFQLTFELVQDSWLQTVQVETTELYGRNHNAEVYLTPEGTVYVVAHGLNGYIHPLEVKPGFRPEQSVVKIGPRANPQLCKIHIKMTDDLPVIIACPAGKITLTKEGAACEPVN